MQVSLAAFCLACHSMALIGTTMRLQTQGNPETMNLGICLENWDRASLSIDLIASG